MAKRRPRQDRIFQWQDTPLYSLDPERVSLPTIVTHDPAITQPRLIPLCPLCAGTGTAWGKPCQCKEDSQ